MALPFLNSGNRKKDQLLALDLGARTTKAVHLQRKGEGYALVRYALLDAPIYEKNLSAELLGEHLKAASQAFNVKGKATCLSVGVTDAVVRTAEMPQLPIGDMRLILKNSAKLYLQQDLPGHTFDCYVLVSRAPAAGAEKPKLGSPVKQKVLVAGAKRQLVTDMQSAVKHAGLAPEAIVPGLIGPVNAFELAMPEVFAKEVVALVDIGFRNSTICLLQEGELILSRVVNIGGDKLTEGLAEALGISYAEAEGIKVGMPQEVQASLEALVSPLGRELRALIDFFEHQQDRQVSQVYVSGGTSRSDPIVEILQSELMLECKRWNPAANLQLALPPEQIAEIEQIAPQLTVAIGVAAAAF